MTRNCLLLLFFYLFGSSRSNVKVMNHDSPVKGDTEEVGHRGSPIKGDIEDVAYEGEDEYDESLSMKRDTSNFDLQAHVHSSGGEYDQSFNEGICRNCSFESEMNEQDHNKVWEKTVGKQLNDPNMNDKIWKK
uniref:Uncharacterized protein n=1 Tax=Solanum tuberosum TaxID=4113 RepID=M1A2Z8_SOLTU